jgi:hypothetical protein
MNATVNTVGMTLQDWQKMLAKQDAEERARNRKRIALLMQAYHAGDYDRFQENMVADEFPWRLACKEFVKLSSVPPEMRFAFQSAWTQHKRPALRNHPLVCAAIHAMLPAYTGPAVRLFRGASELERKRRAYGLSWTSDVAEAETFAEKYRAWPGGSVVLETLAPPAAVISKMEYPEPFTEEERAEIPGAHFTEFHDEREHFVDRRRLTLVKVVRRLPESGR